MSTKSYGPAVSGYSDPEGRSFETTVFQASKPLTDREINLVTDTDQDSQLRFGRSQMPSGWISPGFLGTAADATSGIFASSVVANELEIPNDLQAHVNGWLLRIGNTNANIANKLDLGAGPAGAGAKRTDLVILEVWRKLIAPAPSTDGKSPLGNIWWYGNVKIAPADDAVLNFPDDILDALVGAETTKRVQIQYRLRVIQGVDIFTSPYGVDDPAVLARSVPPAAATPDGNATLFSYTNQSANGDVGLWRAGDGNPANTLGTVDGFMYAIPLCAVFRRNTTAFDRITNHNGGVASPGPSDRPDGLFYDIFASADIVDVRFGVSPVGWNYQEIAEKTLNAILDNSLLTDWTTTLYGGGVNGHLHLWADEIGVSNAHGGVPPTTGDTAGAAFVGEFDAVRRRFSDRAVLETVVIKYTPADGSGGGPNWAPGDVITVNPTALPIHPYAAFNWASYAPSDVAFLDVDAWFIGQAAPQIRSHLDTPSVGGLGAVPVTSLAFEVTTVPPGITDEDLFIYLTVAIPKGVGLSRTPKNTFGVNGLYFNNPGQLPPIAPVSYDQVEYFNIDAPHRELELVYRTQDLVLTLRGPSGPTALLDVLVFPERVLSVSSIVINTIPYGGIVTISPDGFRVTLGPGSFALPTDEAVVTFKAVRPFPQNDEQITLYYQPIAPQTVREALLGLSLPVVPRYLSPYLYVLTAGSGSRGEAYPFSTPYVQAPGIYPSSLGTFSGEHEFDASVGIMLEDFNADTGFLKLETLIPAVPNPDQLVLDRVPGDVDAEDRSYFKAVSGGYILNAWAQPLDEPCRHRCILPILCELTADNLMGKRGQLVMVLVGSYLTPDTFPSTKHNSVAFNAVLAQNTTAASVYRVRGNLLNGRF